MEKNAAGCRLTHFHKPLLAHVVSSISAATLFPLYRLVAAVFCSLHSVFRKFGRNFQQNFNMSASDVVIVSAVRTPIGSFCGNLSSLKAADLGAAVIKESLVRANVDPSEVSEVILGQVLTAGQGQNPARQAAVKAGIPISVPAHLVNMLCGSGLKAVMNGFTSIKVGESQIVVAGGQENMSLAQHTSYLRNSAVKMGDCNLTDSLLFDGLTDAFHNIHMGVTAENIAKEFRISREDQDEYAAKSQQKVQAAMTAGYFNKEIIPITVPTRKEPIIVVKDEYPKSDTTVESLKKLRPAFVKTDGTVTAGNASGINDGAAAVVLMSAQNAAKRGLPTLGTIVAFAQVGVHPKMMGTGPIPAVEVFFFLSKIFLTAASPSLCVRSVRMLLNVGLLVFCIFLSPVKYCICSLIAGTIRIMTSQRHDKSTVPNMNKTSQRRGPVYVPTRDQPWYRFWQTQLEIKS